MVDRRELSLGAYPVIGFWIIKQQVPALMKPLILRSGFVVALPPVRVLVHVVTGAGEATGLL